MNASLRRDIMTPEEKVWHILEHSASHVRIARRAAYDRCREPGTRHYIEYILTDKPDDKINWESTDET